MGVNNSITVWMTPEKHITGITINGHKFLLDSYDIISRTDNASLEWGRHIEKVTYYAKL